MSLYSQTLDEMTPDEQQRLDHDLATALGRSVITGEQAATYLRLLRQGKHPHVWFECHVEWPSTGR
jgi:hypothetical protein